VPDPHDSMSPTSLDKNLPILLLLALGMRCAFFTYMCFPSHRCAGDAICALFSEVCSLPVLSIHDCVVRALCNDDVSASLSLDGQEHPPAIPPMGCPL